ncbi:MAG TPA: paraquat-inducible protein A [Rhodocyclaceae bacterium]|nr:paraquat-inducible protein A [Rhodocyclaceae bacterium]
MNASLTYPARQAASQNLATCSTCGLLSRLPPNASTRVFCPRCTTPLHLRKPNSIARTWALLLTAYLLYIPANLLPVMDSTSLGITQKDTILSGVVYLWTTGDQLLAVIVFIASIVVPLVKLLSLTILVISVQRRWRWQSVQRAKLFWLLDLVGKWSMLDIYVATLLVALVHFGTIKLAEADNGAIAFGAVVVITLFAAKSFDPRLMWDSSEPDDETV